MSTAYVDTSVIASVVLGESQADACLQRLKEFDRLISSNLLEAELRATLARERIPFRRSVVKRIRWVLPLRALDTEITTVLRAGYLSGADLFHVATALYVASRSQPGDLAFLTLDIRQRAVATAVGLATG